MDWQVKFPIGSFLHFKSLSKKDIMTIIGVLLIKVLILNKHKTFGWWITSTLRKTDLSKQPFSKLIQDISAELGLI